MSKQNDARWRDAAGHMVAATDAAERLEVIVEHILNISKKDLAVRLVTDELADVTRDVADELVNALRNAVAAKRSR